VIFLGQLLADQHAGSRVVERLALGRAHVDFRILVEVVGLTAKLKTWLCGS
jgi:hypothetical protein